jgi:enoyl-CoA hydratase/carnithine racemase
MTAYQGRTLSWELRAGVLEVWLHRPPCNEIGSQTLDELERLADTVADKAEHWAGIVIASRLPAGFSAGADLRELYQRMQPLPVEERQRQVRDFLERIHRALLLLDTTPVPVLAAVHGVCFGGGFELALVADVIVADATARFCFPELRLGLIPGFGGIPRLKRDVGNSVVRDLLLTGRSLNATRAHQLGLVSQLVAEGRAFEAARRTAEHLGRFDRTTVARAKSFLKPVPYAELRGEIELFCELFARPAVEEGLRRFVENTSPLPYLP